MEITSVVVKIFSRKGPFVGSADVIFDNEFVVHGVKIIEVNGRVIVSMPNRVNSVRCPNCGAKSPADFRFCGGCGVLMPQTTEKSFSDVAHPIKAEARKRLNDAIIQAYIEALKAEHQTPHLHHACDDHST